MATAATIIEDALRKLGVIASGEDPSSAEQADGLSALNNMIESFSNENLLIFDDNEETFSLVASTQSYTMGSGATFDTSRPLEITDARLKVTTSSPNYEIPIEIINLDEWKRISQKTTTSDIPTKLYVDYSYPNATLNFWPVPSAANSVILNSKKLITSFATAATTVSLPPGWNRMLTYNLAIEVASEYGIEPSLTIQKIAMDSKAALKRTNKKPRYLSCEVASLTNGKSYNILTGE